MMLGKKTLETLLDWCLEYDEIKDDILNDETIMSDLYKYFKNNDSFIFKRLESLLNQKATYTQYFIEESSEINFSKLNDFSLTDIEFNKLKDKYYKDIEHFLNMFSEGGSRFFDAHDKLLSSEKSKGAYTEFYDKLLLHVLNETYFKKYINSTLVVSGKFGRKILNYLSTVLNLKISKVKNDKNFITQNDKTRLSILLFRGGLREYELNEKYKIRNGSDLNWIFLDDSIYSGKTLYEITKTIGCDPKAISVFYDGSWFSNKHIYSLYKYHSI